MLLIVGTIRIPPDSLDIARPAMTAMVNASRTEPGCVHYSYAEDMLEPGLIHVKELWNDRAALELHFSSNHIAQWRASWPEIGVTDRQLKLFEIGEAELI